MNAPSSCSLHGDRWNDMLDEGWQLENPSAIELEEALRRLDAKAYTMLTLTTGPNRHLAIGGGDGRYVVYASIDNDQFFNLVRPDAPSGTVLLKVGGQEGDFPAAQIVTLAQAQAAALFYLDASELDPSQRWVAQ